MNSGLKIAAGAVALFLLALVLYQQSTICRLQDSIDTLSETQAPEPPSAVSGQTASPAAPTVVVREAVPAPAPQTGPGFPAVLKRMEKLELRLSQLEQATRALLHEQKAVPASGPDYEGRLHALSAQLQTLAAQMEALKSGAAFKSEEGTSYIQGVVQDEFKKRREQRRERHQVMSDQITDEIVNKFAADADLSDEQIATLYPQLQELKESFRQSWRSVRRGEKDFSEAREEVKAAFAKMDEQARKTLSDEQYKMYQKETEKHFSGPAGLFR